MGSFNPTYSPGGSLVAGFSPTTQNAINNAGGVVDSQNQIAGQGASAASNVLGGQFLSPDSNPHLRGAADSAVASVMRGLTEQALPALDDQAVIAGGVGGTGDAVARSLATERATRAGLDATTNMYSNAYNQALNQYTQTLMALPALQQMQGAGLQTGLQVGAMEQQQEQNQIDAGIAQHQFNQQAPIQATQSYLNSLLQFPGTQTGTAPGAQRSPIASGLGFGLMAAANPITAPYAVGAGLLGAFA